MKKFTLYTSILFFTGLNAQSQNVGIGTTTPAAKLEVKGVGNTSLTNNLILRNSSGDTLLRVRNDGRMTLDYNGVSVGRTLNLGGNGLNFYKTDDIFGGAIFPTDTSLIIWSNSNANNYVILQPSWGKVGIGTYSPKAILHVRRDTSGATPTTEAVSVFESNGDASINLLTPGANFSAIQFGNPSNNRQGSISYNEVSANGLSFRVNSSTRAVLDNNGNLGVGDLTPNARLHVSNGNGGTMYFSDADLIVEDNTQAYIQFSVPNSETSGLLAGNAATSIRSALLFMADSSVQIRAGGNTPRAVINNAGNVGIGDNTPSARLDIKGSDGSVNNHIRLEDNNSSDFSNIYYTGDLILKNNRVDGDFYFKNDAGVNAMSLFSSGNMTITGSLTQNSDLRLKYNILPLDSSLEKLLRLNGYNYYWKPELNKDHSLQTGLIAQEVEQVFPELVRTDTDGLKSVNYTGVIPYMIEAFKEQQTIISSQRMKLDAQQLKVEVLEKEMQEMKSLVLQLMSQK